MNNGNFNNHNFPYNAQDYPEQYKMDCIEAFNGEDAQQDFPQSDAQMGYQLGDTYEYQPENMYDFNDIGEYQTEFQTESIQEYSQIETQGHQLNTQLMNAHGIQPNSIAAARNAQPFNPSYGRLYQNQQTNSASPLQDINGFTASSESSFASQASPKKQLQCLREPQLQETPSQVNGILQMEGSVEPNGPILGGQGYIPAQTVQKAYYELGETPEIKAACLRGFRQQIEINQEENNFDEHSDAFLLKFLRGRKFDVEAAYSLLEKYYNVRENKPEVFRNLTRKNVKRTMEQGIVGVLPQRDKKGRAIVTFNFNGWNMSLAFHFEKLLRVFVFTLEKLFESEETQINGIVIISNLAQLSLLQTKNLGATMITKILEIFEGNLPFRLNAIHLLNPPWHFKLLWKMVDPLTKIKPKIARRIYIHDGDLSRFHAEFESELLPKELGGKCPPYDNTLWVKELLDPEQGQQPQKQMQTLQQPSASRGRRSPSPARRAVNR